MSHPTDMLAPYVDGTLEPTDRSAVDAHLRSCERCRREVAAATAARRAVLSMPTPKGRALQRLVGWRLCRRIQSLRA